MKFSGFFTLFSGIFVTFCAFAQDGTKSIKPVSVARRVALVIGNSDYRFIQGVPPASADADDMAQSLRNLHFDLVAVKKDLGADALIAEIGRFTRAEVQPGDLALVYYSGHGGQVGEENYLLPIDYEPPSDDELVERRAYKMSRVRDALERTNARVRVLIFDACRNSPVTTTKSAASGLRAMDGKPEGTLIAYASAHNQVARYDGSRNSFYTSELLSELKQPTADLKSVFERVQNRVYERTGHQQTPYLYGFLSGPLYLAGAPVLTNEPQLAAADPAREAWELAKGTKNRAMLEAVAREFPDSPYARLARVELAGLEASSMGAPRLLSPADGAVFDIFPRATTCQWEASAGAASYIFEWNYWSPNASVWVGIDHHPEVAVKGTQYSLDFVGAQPGRWRVWPISADGRRGTPSEWRTFRYTK